MGLDLTNTVDTAAVEDAGRRITLLDEAEEPYIDPETGKPVTALVAGTYSKRFTTAQQKQREKLSRRPGKRSAEQKLEDARELFAVCVIEWDLVAKGKMAPPAEIFRLKPHIYDQIVNEATNHADFFAPSSTP